MTGFDECVARPSTATTYVLRATGEGGPVTQSVTVMVTEQPSDPEVVSLTASATTIQQGGSVTISWVTRNGDLRRLVVDPTGEPFTQSEVAASGSQTFTPSVTTEYSISVTNQSDQSISDREFITVTVTAVPAAVVDSFSTSEPDYPRRLVRTSRLSWTTTGATRVRLQGDTGNPFGQFQLTSGVIVRRMALTLLTRWGVGAES